MASNVKIVFLGTGGSVPKPGRGLPAVAIHIDNILNLFDCGEGTQKQLMKSSISFMDITNIFITHFHGDHFFGLPGLLNTLSFMGRKNDLNIFGPEGTLNFIKKATELGYGNIGYNINAYELKPDKTYDFDKFYIKTLKNDHPVPALSYSLEEKDLIKIDKNIVDKIKFPVRRLEELREKGSLKIDNKEYKIEDLSSGIRKGRKIVYTGDTRPMESMKLFAKNADVLIHDTTMDSSLEPLVNEYGHTSAKQAAEIAKDANVRRLFLYHYSSRYNDLNVLLNEAKSVFNESYLSKELMEYDVPKTDELIKINKD